MQTEDGIFVHKCEESGCTKQVQFDDEPKCFTHSPDSGSSVRGYSARAKAAAVKAIQETVGRQYLGRGDSQPGIVNPVPQVNLKAEWDTTVKSLGNSMRNPTAVETPDLRTIVNFYKGDEIVRTVSNTHEIQNVVVGQAFIFDHPSMSQGLSGVVYDISHVVFLGNEAPVTYIEVRVP